MTLSTLAGPSLRCVQRMTPHRWRWLVEPREGSQSVSGHSDSKAQAEQIRSIAVERVGHRLGVVPNAIMLDIDEALRLHLGL
jgi:mRNA-degrading endonuclease toxin of MazEF toxin-antitoxin module